LVAELEFPRFGGHLIAGSAVSDLAGRMSAPAKGIELQVLREEREVLRKAAVPVA
jgi:hypothetical protein